jgi:uncharacterized Fe-S cluster-containing radical SAM superfamily protein
MLIDPLRLAAETEMIVVQGDFKKYYRAARPAKWYSGIASADCCGCNLRCVFCWSGAPRDNPEGLGKFHSPNQIFNSLTRCAEKFNYEQLRVTGNEATIGRSHLLKLLELIDQTKFTFILETNGILIGHDPDFAKQLAKFKCVNVRVSVKGTNPQEFSILTGATPEAFTLQLKALKNLLDASVSCHPAVMLSFSTRKSFEGLLNRLREIDQRLPGSIEEEYIFLYPHVVNRLHRVGIKPHTAYEPGRVPKELV